ncbi:RagB/SusD family nutrient uptake outer membrane protein [Fodinibius halophilus]|uniref:RagB/SusD family nutrient uptake outer membrane protein n=1 Tax=Fodinibius halophilus TaxID=1736908 RepID=A0A6M1T9R6_9BACT|nr:RagB/SusD family nutrient uptake outer membrane protein [Fodinibius halophilus]NGP89253.1 RagB/SusD family nutrient uptake outer membrane protein [Fodinibius halophilus]
MKYLLKILIVFYGFLLLQGCNDLLENTEPSTSVSQELALNNPDAIRGLRARMYARFQAAPEMNTTWLLGPSALADNTDIGSGTRFESLNNNEFESGVGTAAWSDLYDMINDANILLKGVPEGVVTDENLTKYHGEAYFMRALALHHLVRIFGYEPGMAPSSGKAAGFDLGVIIRTEPTLDVSDADFKERKTVSEVYQQIESDLNDALTKLKQHSSDGPFYVTPAAAQALLARVHLYQKNYEEANTAASEAISSSGARLATASEVSSMFDETVNNPEAIFTVDVDPATESGGTNDALAAYTSMQWFGQIPTQDLIDSYDSNDARLDAWYTLCFNDVTEEATNDCAGVNAGNLELHKYAAEQGQFADDYVHFRVGEMVLIQAEALLDTDGPSAAIAKLDELRSHRGLGAYSGPTTEQAVLDEILAERRRELVAEGHRFFDLKRLGRDLRKVKFDPDNGTTTVSYLRYDSYVYLDDLPDGEVELNPKLVENPFFD